MEIRHLRYFVAAAEELNLTRASEKLHISQPAVSRLIRDLEEELGTALFLREPSGLKLTIAGRKFLGYARQILRLGFEAARVVGALQTDSQPLNIGFFSTPIGDFLAFTLHNFRLNNPEVTFQMHELCPGDQAKALRNQRIDIAVVGNHGGVLKHEFEVMSLFERPLEAVVSQSHCLAGQKLISLKDLEKDHFIGYAEENMPGRNQALIEACQAAEFEPDLRYKVNSLAEALLMIGSGVGVSLMTDDMIRMHQHNTHFASIIEPLEAYPIVAAWRRDNDSQLVRALVGYIRERVEDKCYSALPKTQCN